jgi:hypothetical protein
LYFQTRHYMSSLLNLKISTALVIVLAFSFRLFFVNVNLIPSFNNSNTTKLFSAHFSSFQKKRRQEQASAQSNIIQTEEVYSEVADTKQILFKSAAPAFLFLLYALFKNNIFSGQSNFSFNSVNRYLYPKKYLAFAGLRI